MTELPAAGSSEAWNGWPQGWSDTAAWRPHALVAFRHSLLRVKLEC